MTFEKGLVMAKVERQALDGLSDRERQVVGAPDDYDWATAVRQTPRSRPESVQFSLRVERSLLNSLQAFAAARNATVSDVARDALARYVRADGRPAISNVQVSFPRDVGVLLQVHGGRAELSPNRRDASPDERTPDQVGAGTY